MNFKGAGKHWDIFSSFFSASGLFGPSQNASCTVLAATPRCCFRCTVSWWIIKWAQWSRETPVQLSRLWSLCRSFSLQLHLQLRRSIPTRLGLRSSSPHSAETHTRTSPVSHGRRDLWRNSERRTAHFTPLPLKGLRPVTNPKRELPHGCRVIDRSVLSTRAFLYTSSSALSLQGQVSQGDQSCHQCRSHLEKAALVMSLKTAGEAFNSNLIRIVK